MASAGGVRAGKAFVEAYLDATKLERGLNQALGKMRSFASGLRQLGVAMTVAGSAIVAPFLFGVKSLMGMSDSISDIQNNTDLSAEAIQRLTIGAEELGVASETTATALSTMGRVIGLAMDGNKKAKKSIEDLGLSLDKVKSSAPDQRLRMVFDALRNIEDPALRLSRGSQILGSGFKEMGDIFKMTGSEFDSLTDRLAKGGMLLSDADIQAGQDLKKAWVEIRTAVVKLAAALAATFTPALLNIISRAVDIVINFKAWTKENKGLIAVVLALGGGLVALGSALVVVGAALGWVVTIIGTLGTVAIKFLGWLTAAPGKLASFISSLFGLQRAMSKTAGAFLGVFGTNIDKVFHALGLGLKSLTGAWKLLSFAVGTAVWYGFIKSMEFLNGQFLKLNNQIQTFGAGFKKAFSGVGSAVSATFKGIGAAIQAGNIELAFKILWTGIKLTTLEILASIPKAIMSILTNIGVRVLDFAAMLTTTIVDLGTELAKAVEHAWSWMVSVFEWAMGKFKELQETAAHKIAEIWVLVSTLAAGGTLEEAGQKLLMLDEMHSQAMKDIETENAARQKEIDAERDARLAAIDEVRQGMISAIDGFFRAWEEGVMEINPLLEEWLNEKLGINELRKKLEELRKQAEAEATKPLSGMIVYKPPKAAVPARTDLMAQGQFGAWSVRGLQLAGPLDKLTKAAEETADNTAYIADNMGEGGLAVE